jgi:hypothetical protein
MQSSGIWISTVVDRLQQARLGGRERLLEREITGDLERDVLGIHRVHLAVVKINLHVRHAAAGEDALGAGLVDALLDGRHETCGPRSGRPANW